MRTGKEWEAINRPMKQKYSKKKPMSYGDLVFDKDSFQNRGERMA